MRELIEVLQKKFDGKQPPSASVQGKRASQNFLQSSYGHPYDRKSQTEELIGILIFLS